MDSSGASQLNKLYVEIYSPGRINSWYKLYKVAIVIIKLIFLYTAGGGSSVALWEFHRVRHVLGDNLKPEVEILPQVWIVLVTLGSIDALVGWVKL